MEKEWQIREREARCGMLVYIYGKSGPDLYGEIENFYLKNTEPFQNTGELILKLDKICGNVAAMREWERILEDMSYMGIGREYGARVEFGRTGRISSSSEILKERVRRAREIVMIDIEHRNHASLQGKLRGKITSWRFACFHSELELMKMLNIINVSDKEKTGGES